MVLLVDVRPQVAVFAGRMERCLRSNDHKGGWRHMNNRSLMARVVQELDELRDALSSKNRDRIAAEAADVANFLMMLCQNNGALGIANEAPCRPANQDGGAL